MRREDVTRVREGIAARRSWRYRRNVGPEFDPIGALIEALEHDGKPTLAWVVRWSNAGREPVQAAWTASGDPWAMVQLLMHTGRDWPLGRYSLVNSGGLRRRRAVGDDEGENPAEQYVVLGEGAATVFIRRDDEGAREIRRRIPQPPGLDTVMQLGRRFVRPLG